jgi:exopolyphosphatase/guanosine-5'-triphosphate,3'-diphosphate pyrophosphatase
MRIGIIDLGTNSVRFDIYEIHSLSGGFERLHREKIMVRLGQDIFSKGRLNSQASQRTLKAFIQFKKVSKEFKTKKIIAFATSALRESKNPEKLLIPIEKKTGIKVQVISGKREAELIARGILKNIKMPSGAFGLIDIGGGSTEISLYKNKKLIFSESFPVGTARLQQLHLTKIPPTPRSIQNARAFIRKTLEEGFKNNDFKIKKIPKTIRFIGSSGTIKALDLLLKKRYNTKVITQKHVSKLTHELEPMSYKQLLKFPHMDEKKIDQIVSGSIILEEFLNAFNGTKMSFSEYCLRDGIFDEQVNSLKTTRLKNLLGTNLNYFFRFTKKITKTLLQPAK